MQTKLTFSDGLFERVKLGHLYAELESTKKKLSHEKHVKAGYISAYVKLKKNK
jgi:hypothetical protein